MTTHRLETATATAETITVNGERREVGPDTTVSILLAELDLEEGEVAVELDRDILPRGLWASTTLAGGASLEIVHFVGGG